MINKFLDSITLEDVQALKSNAEPEGKTFEYKQQLPGDSQEEKKKTLRAICSLANTAGGDLIYGIEAKDGIPIAFPGIDGTNQDDLRLRLENSVRDGIQPRLPPVHFRFIPTSPGRSVLLVRVQKSWNAPHRLAHDGHFYGRNSAGCYQLDVGELRQAFTLSGGVIDRVRTFRADRLMKIAANSSPVALVDGVKMVFHMIPFSAFSSAPEQRIELAPSQRMSFDPIGTRAFAAGVNLDGYYRYFGSSPDQTKAYTQVFRSGVVESVVSFGPFNKPKVDRPIPTKYIETNLVTSVNIYRNALSTAGVSAPFLFFLAFINVKGSQLISEGGGFPDPAPLNERDTDMLILPEAIAEVEGFDAAQALKPLFDSYWNAYGYEGSQNYDESGKWIHGGAGL